MALATVGWVPGPPGRWLRRGVVGMGVRRAGNRLRLDTGLRITGWRNIELGDDINAMRSGSWHAHDGSLRVGSNVSINENVIIAPADGGRITIGNDVLIGPNVVLRAADHRHDDTAVPIIRQGHVGGEITIEDGVWIGANVVVTRGVRIGAHSIVGAGAVVTRDVAPYSVVGGVPARLIRRRMDAG